MIFLREIIEGGNQRYECIDGQQRLQCIFQFLDDQFEITPDITPELEQKHSFSDLSSETRSEILSFEINSIVVQYADDDTITEIFMRLQEGVRLNPAEKLNAERSKMRKAVIEISKHKFFGSTRLKNIRFSYRYYAAQMLTLSVHPRSMDGGYTSLKRTYDSFKNGFPRQAKDKTNHSLTTLKNILGTRARVIRSKSDILVLHLIASQLLPSYSIHGFENRIAEFIIRFISKVSKLSQRANEQSKDPYVRYAYFKKFAFLRLQDKYDIMASELLQAIPDLRPKDPNRRFNDTERLAICLRAKETCARCGNFAEFEDGQADHIIQHSKGGQTILSNGRWLCKPCHKIIHGKKTLGD